MKLKVVIKQIIFDQWKFSLNSGDGLSYIFKAVGKVDSTVEVRLHQVCIGADDTTEYNANNKDHQPGDGVRIYGYILLSQPHIKTASKLCKLHYLKNRLRKSPMFVVIFILHLRICLIKSVVFSLY